jgi:hypothetical protein
MEVAKHTGAALRKAGSLSPSSIYEASENSPGPGIRRREKKFG